MYGEVGYGDATALNKTATAFCASRPDDDPFCLAWLWALLPLSTSCTAPKMCGARVG